RLPFSSDRLWLPEPTTPRYGGWRRWSIPIGRLLRAGRITPIGRCAERLADALQPRSGRQRQRQRAAAEGPAQRLRTGGIGGMRGHRAGGARLQALAAAFAARFLQRPQGMKQAGPL